MKNNICWLAPLFVTVLTLDSCKKTVEYEQKGVFAITNQSGKDIILRVFNTQKRSQVPLVIPIANGASAERMAYGGAGAIAYPELFFQGDSVKISFSDGKQLFHYCPQNKQLNNTCSPSHNILSLSQYKIEAIDKNYNRYTYVLTNSDYSEAQ